MGENRRTSAETSRLIADLINEALAARSSDGALAFALATRDGDDHT